MKTRERIKLTAIENFNEFGATNVSTIKLSNIMSISPGNYYYYFSSKEDLIRVIWEENILPHSNHVFFDREYDPTAAGIRSFIEASVHHIYKYRFFYTELYILQKNDPKLAESYLSHWDKLIAQGIKLFEDWEKSDLLTLPQDPETKKWLVEGILLVSRVRMGFSQIRNARIEAFNIKKQIVLQIQSLFIPSLTTKGNHQIKELLK